MKKIIAIAMALVMMMAVAVPAFAADLNVATNEGDAVVKTNTSAVTESYTVTYPAVMDLVWGTESTPFEYSVTSQLKTGNCVEVSVADKDAAYVMANATGETLAYALAGTTATKTSAPVVTDETFNYSVDVAAAAWAAAAFDTYEDTLTFTSAIVAF